MLFSFKKLKSDDRFVILCRMNERIRIRKMRDNKAGFDGYQEEML